MTRMIATNAAIVTILRISFSTCFSEATCGLQPASPQVPLRNPSTVGDDVDDGFRERTGRFLGQIMPDAAVNSPVRVFA
jgi:hypothetical protein